jgi:hypothetical protein
MGGACGMGRKNADGKKPLARPRSRLGTVKKILGGIRWQAVDWIHLSQETEKLLSSCVHVN